MISPVDNESSPSPDWGYALRLIAPPKMDVAIRINTMAASVSQFIKKAKNDACFPCSVTKERLLEYRVLTVDAHACLLKYLGLQPDVTQSTLLQWRRTALEMSEGYEALRRQALADSYAGESGDLDAGTRQEKSVREMEAEIRALHRGITSLEGIMAFIANPFQDSEKEKILPLLSVIIDIQRLFDYGLVGYPESV